ncbi:MAG: hypothetical protein ACKOW4_06960 [Aquirufa sp.]
MFTKFVPLYTCSSPLVPQSEHHKISPASGETMADFWAKVKRGNSRPFEVDVISKMAAEDGVEVPMATVPVNTGEAIGAFDVMAFVFAVMLAVFATTVVVNPTKFVALLVMLAVLAATLFVSTNSAARAVEASEIIAALFEAMLAVFTLTLEVNVTKSVTFAFNANPGTVGASAVPFKSPVNLIFPLVVASASAMVAAANLAKT